MTCGRFSPLAALVCLIVVPPAAFAGSCADYLDGLPSSFSSMVTNATMVRVVGDLAFVGVHVAAPPPSIELRIYDVADPSGPALLSAIPYADAEFPRGIAIDGTTLHVALEGIGFGGFGGGFSTVDITDVSAPAKLGFTSPQTHFRSVVVSNGIAYLSDVPECCGGSVSAYDVSNASNPTFLTSFSATAYDLALVADVLYVPAIGSLGYYDISTPGAPVLIDSIDNEDWWFVNAVIDGDRLFVSVFDTSVGSETRLLVYDVSVPEMPVEVGNALLGGGGPSTLAVRENAAYVAAAASDLHVVSIDGAGTPTLYTTVSLPDGANRADAGASALWIADDTSLTAYPLQCAPITGVPEGGSVSSLAVLPAVPFRRGDDISIRLLDDGYAALDVFDALGRRVRDLHDGPIGGAPSFRWDGTDTSGRRVAAGVYFVRLATQGQTATARLVLID